MQHEGEVGLRLGGEHARRSEAFVVDQGGVVAAFPFDGVRRIGDDGIEGLVITKLRIDQAIAQLDVELVVIDVVQEHVHPRQVVGGVVDLLPKEAVFDHMGVEVLFRL